MLNPVSLAATLAALLGLVMPSSSMLQNGQEVFDGDRYQVSKQVYQQGDMTVEETVYEVDIDLPENGVMEFDGDPSTISGLPKS